MQTSYHFEGYSDDALERAIRMHYELAIQHRREGSYAMSRWSQKMATEGTIEYLRRRQLETIHEEYVQLRLEEMVTRNAEADELGA